MSNSNDSVSCALLSLLIVALLVVVGLFAMNLYAPTVGAQTPVQSERTVTVMGEGVVVGTPDKATVGVGVEVSAESVESAMTQNEATVAQIMAALQAAGIEKKDIQTSNFSVWPEQNYDEATGTSRITGYRVSNQVSVTIRDIAKISDVLAGVTNAGANSIYGISFNVDDPTALMNDAREKAMANARERAEALAALSGYSLGEVVTISEVGNSHPMPAMGGGGMAYEMAASDISISEGSLSFTNSVQVMFLLDN